MAISKGKHVVSSRTNYSHYSKNSSDLGCEGQEKRPAEALDPQNSTNSTSSSKDQDFGINADRLEQTVPDAPGSRPAEQSAQVVLPTDTDSQAVRPGDLDELLADLDMSGANVETAEEVIAEMSPDDLDADDERVRVADEALQQRMRKASEHLEATIAKRGKPYYGASVSPKFVEQPEMVPVSAVTAKTAVPPHFPGSSEPPPVSADKAKNHRRPSPFRDACFMRKLKILHEAALYYGAPAPSVIKALSSTSLKSLRSKAKTDALTPLESLHALLFHNFHPYRAWWHENHFPSLPPPIPQWRAPAEWEAASDHLVATYRHIGLKTFGPVCAISCNLRNDIEEQAHKQKYPLGWLRSRVSHHLMSKLNRSVQFQLFLEETPDHTRRLHIHGEYQIPAHEVADASEAVRKACGVIDGKAGDYQVDVKPNPDAGWLNYLLLDLRRVGFARNILPRIALADPARIPSSAVSFGGSAISSTEKLHKRAAEIYEEHHRQFIKMNRK
jgi:hypothetical protein